KWIYRVVPTAHLSPGYVVVDFRFSPQPRDRLQEASLRSSLPVKSLAFDKGRLRLPSNLFPNPFLQSGFTGESPAPMNPYVHGRTGSICSVGSGDRSAQNQVTSNRKRSHGVRSLTHSTDAA